MVDPKVVGGGVAVVAIGGGSGYAISQAVSSSNENSNPKTTQENPPKQESDLIAANKQVLSNAGFVIDNTQEEATDCKNKLKEETKTAGENNEFKSLVETCYKGKKFSDKAEQLGLDVLKEGNDSAWSSSWSTDKETVKTIVTSTDSKNDWSGAKSDVISFCTSSETEKGNKVINKDSTDADWKNFLKVCTKNKSTSETGKETKEVILTKNFWTGVATTAGTT